jgi:hypothetical protein
VDESSSCGDSPCLICKELIESGEEGVEAGLFVTTSGALRALATAIAGQADAIVTGGDDLLALGHYQGVAILGPRQLLERLTLRR